MVELVVELDQVSLLGSLEFVAVYGDVADLMAHVALELKDRIVVVVPKLGPNSVIEFHNLAKVLRHL